MAVAAVVSFSRPIMTMAEGRTTTTMTAKEEEESTTLKYLHSGKACPKYGCPLFPIDGDFVDFLNCEIEIPLWSIKHNMSKCQA